MTFNPNIPQANDIIANSQLDILNNFGALNTIFDVDHVTFDAASNNGKHDKSTYVEQGADPVTGAGEIAVYSKDVGGASTLFIAPDSAGAVYQLSGIAPSLGTDGYTWLPGGLLLQWFRKNLTVGNHVTQTFSFPTPFSGNAYIVTYTVNQAIASGSDTDTAIIGTPTDTQFTVENRTGTTTFVLYCIAIGPA